MYIEILQIKSLPLMNYRSSLKHKIIVIIIIMSFLETEI